jgi:SPP1 gp7 family putative phage head morphogenesis protein
MSVLVKHVKSSGTLSQEQSQLMKDGIRNSVQRIWVVGAQYAANFLNRDFIMTQTDINHIKTLSQEFSDRMQWRIENYVLGRPEESNQIETSFITSTFAGYVAPRSLSVAIREKVRQIQTQQQSNLIASVGTASAAAAEEDNQLPEPTIVLKWVTAKDDKVCPICSTLEGTLFRYDDPDIPEPDSDTHPWCRCMLRLAEAEFE